MSKLSLLIGESLKKRPDPPESFEAKEDSPDNVIDLEKLNAEDIAECNVPSHPMKLSSNGDTNSVKNEELSRPLSFVETCRATFSNDRNQTEKVNMEVQQGAGNVVLKDPVYSSTSKMLSDNEMLITLSSSLKDNEGTNIDVDDDFAFIDQLDYENHVEIAAGTFDFQYKRHIFEEDIQSMDSSNQNTEIVTENVNPVWKNSNPITTDSSVRILSVAGFENDNQTRNDNSIIIENFVDERNCDFDSVERQCDDSVMIEGEINSFEKCSQKELDKRLEDKPASQEETVPPLKAKKVFNLRNRSKIHRRVWDLKFNYVTKSNENDANPNVKRKRGKVNRKLKTTRNAIIDLEKTKASLSTKLKNCTVQTYSKKIKSVDTDPCEKLYQKLPLPDQQTENKEKPNEFSVFEFHDEDDEKLKIEIEKAENELKALKERTCRYCKEVFNDPIYVLRHTREMHTPRKVVVSKKDIEPLLELENRERCPLCFVQIRNRYKSVYVKHLMTHVEDSDLSCKICGIKFKRKDNLEAHEKRHVLS